MALKITDFSYDNPIYGKLREPARRVVAEYQNAARFLDTTQEYIYIEVGMKYLSRLVHNLAHEMPKRFDEFGDLLHERHLMVEYPATAEMDWREELKSLDDCFGVVLGVLENIQEALEAFHVATDNAQFRPFALKAEEFMLQVSADHTVFLEIWKRYKTDGGSLTSLDSWVAKYFHLDEEDDD